MACHIGMTSDLPRRLRELALGPEGFRYYFLFENGRRLTYGDAQICEDIHRRAHPQCGGSAGGRRLSSPPWETGAVFVVYCVSDTDPGGYLPIPPAA